MHLTPDTETERFIKPDRARIVGVAVQKGRLAARDHFAHDMADQRAREPAAAAIGPCRDAADLGHAGGEDALSRPREQPALFADSKEGPVAMRRRPDRKSTPLNSRHQCAPRMPSS